MTDNATPQGVEDPIPTAAELAQHRISWNIRAEIVRRGKTIAEARAAIGMPSSTWDNRMKDPMTWRLRELTALAKFLRTTPGSLVD